MPDHQLDSVSEVFCITTAVDTLFGDVDDLTELPGNDLKNDAMCVYARCILRVGGEGVGVGGRGEREERCVRAGK